MYVATIPNRNSPPAILLREAFRLDGKVKNRTLANLSRWPPEKIEALRRVLKGETTLGAALPEACSIARSLPHGHVAAVLANHRTPAAAAAARSQAGPPARSGAGDDRRPHP